MDIHKPKPIHGWRDFIKEIGIIVIGVSIALAGEQAVEKWRQHRQHDEARQAMRDELSNDVANIGRRERFAACTRQRIKDIGAILVRAESGQPFEAPSWIGPSFSYRMRFNAESEAQKSALFSTAEQYGYGSPYNYFHSIDLEQDRERLAWGRLRMLEGQSHISPEMIQTLRNALADARFEDERIAYLTLWAKTFGKQLGLNDLSHEGQYTSNIFRHHPHCLPMNMPAAQAEHESETVITPLLADQRFKTMPDFERR